MGTMTGMPVLALVLSVAASVFFAAGFVLQYHEAHAAPDRLFLSPRLLLELMHHRLWLAGIAAMIAGSALQAWALSVGSLAVVEPVTTATVLFALPLAAAWQRERVQPHEWIGAEMISAGIGLLLGVGSPTPGRATMGGWQWLLVVLSTWGLALSLVAASRRIKVPGLCTAGIAGAAGVLFGLQDALTRSFLDQFTHGVGGLFFSWQPYVLGVTAIYGLTLAQSAYEAGTFSASLPPLIVAEPVVGMLIGIFALGERLDNSPAALGLEAFGAAVMIAGTWLLARSPLVTGDVGRRRHHPAAAAARLVRGRRRSAAAARR